MSSSPKPPRHIHIDHLVLPPGTVGARRIQAAIESELARLMGQDKTARSAVLPDVTVTPEPTIDGRKFGGAIARQIHGKMKSGL